MEKPVLRFNDGGKFRVLMISDFHAGKSYNPKLKKGIEALLEETKPDFVMVGGDQVLEKDNYDDVKAYMADIMEPVISRKIPWGTIFGNHDREVGIDIALEEKAYEEIPYCMSESGPEELHGIGNYCLTILSSEDDKPAFNLWAMDSNRYIEDYAEMFGMDKNTRFRLPDHFNYGANGAAPLFDQIQWYFNKSLNMEKESGKKIPGIMFMHIPLQEYLEVLRNPEECGARGDMREKCGATEINSGLFLAGLQRGDIKGYFFGHEHLIDIQGEYCGVTLACDAAIGYNMSAHDDLRGGRVIDITEDGTISTRMIKLMDLLGRDAMRDPSYMEGGCYYFIRKL
ncbi:MAG: metallophosphoesterase [Clostridia bacterium]|nr:metallophosphoesterase [Clostridia bacterium]